MRTPLLFCTFATLITLQAKTQATTPYTTCPDVNIAVVRAGTNSTTTNPYFLYHVDVPTGAMTQVGGGPYKDPSNPSVNLQVNAVGVNRMDGFIYGFSTESTSATARFLRLDRNYGVTNLGNIPAPAAPDGQMGFINSAAGDMDANGNYYFTAGILNTSTFQITNFYLGVIANTQSYITGPVTVNYYEIDVSAANCAALLSTFTSDPENSGIKDFSYNATTNTFFSYATYKTSPGAANFSGQSLELTPIAGSSPTRYSIQCTPVINTHTAEVSGTLIANSGDFLVLLTDGTVGRIGSPSPNTYNGQFIPLNNATGLPNPLRGDMASCSGASLTLSQWYRDFDNDGFGDPVRSTMSATQPAGYVSNNLDCNDYRVYYQDMDNDGWGSSVKVPCGMITRTGDCNDNDRRVHSPQTFYRDADGDSYGDANNSIRVCSSVPPAGYVKNRIDCNDNDRRVYWAKTYYRDADGDGLGDPNNRISVCSSTPPAGYVTNSRDTNDTPVTVSNTRLGTAGEVPQEARMMPHKFALAAYPNPFNRQTRIQYTVPVDAQVNIRVFDVLGREVGLIFNGQRNAGTHYAEYNSEKLAGGLYYIRLAALTNGKEHLQTLKLVKAE